ncbi:MAG: type II toxin-antitoxin system PemK/MazF family toxin [Planctomycetes bacterium]|nr:type II toxin-antitoxin system PemK/MazF family toxin [Planctomycetota bacterium]
MKPPAPSAKPRALTQDSLILGYMLSVMSESLLQEKIGRLPAEAMQQLDACLKAALDLS